MLEAGAPESLSEHFLSLLPAYQRRRNRARKEASGQSARWTTGGRLGEHLWVCWITPEHESLGKAHRRLSQLMRDHRRQLIRNQAPCSLRKASHRNPRNPRKLMRRNTSVTRREQAETGERRCARMTFSQCHFLSLINLRFVPSLLLLIARQCGMCGMKSRSYCGRYSSATNSRCSFI